MSVPIYAGIDIGGTNIKIGLVDDSAQTVAFESIPTQSELGPEDAAKRVAETLTGLAEKAGTTIAELAGVGLASPGPMDLKTGMLLCPGNLPEWHNTPLRQLFTDAVGQPVNYSNDANAAAYGEFWGGAGHRFESLVLFTLGTGVGGGIILGDTIIDGAHSCGSELGHIIIDAADDAPLNSLGIRGTLEGYCGSYGVVGRAQAAIADRFVETSLRDTVEEGEELTPLMIANAAEAGDELALKVVMDTAKYLGIGIVSAVHAIDPEGIVIGGAMTFGGAGHPLGERFLEEVRKQTTERLIPSLRGEIAIEFAKLGGNAGYIGAAGRARVALSR